MSEQQKPFGLFSWETTVLSGEDRRELFALMERYGLNELYQNIPEGTDEGVLGSFLAEADRREIAVYLLAGDPRWGLDQSGERVVYEVRRAAALNDRLTGVRGLSGVMLDVEPYLTGEWEEDPGWVMKRYVSAMKAACAQAEEEGLRSIVCIPYYYDTEGFTEELEELIGEGAHAVAVMNYYKGRELEHLCAELAIAEAKKKTVLTIYELQPAGSGGLEETNTYYTEGMDGVLKSWREISKRAKSSRLSCAIHNYEALREVSSRE